MHLATVDFHLQHATADGRVDGMKLFHLEGEGEDRLLR